MLELPEHTVFEDNQSIEYDNNEGDQYYRIDDDDQMSQNSQKVEELQEKKEIHIIEEEIPKSNIFR